MEQQQEHKPRHHPTELRLWHHLRVTRLSRRVSPCPLLSRADRVWMSLGERRPGPSGKLIRQALPGAPGFPGKRAAPEGERPWPRLIPEHAQRRRGNMAELEE